MNDNVVPRFSDEAPDSEQFRLIQLQTFNWGTFSDLNTVAISEAGYLFTGPSGSGKSTLLDAHAQLLTPPKWMDYNVAARENDRSGKDRTLLTYVRGAWAKNTQENREVATQYLRTGSTFSAIAETYVNGSGRTVVLAQLFWITGSSNQAQDVRKRFFVFEREFDVRDFGFFAERQFDVRQLKVKFDGEFIREDFNSYQERFRRLLGIESDRALRLLHKTQSAKNLGDLNEFLREFMLDPPETFDLAEKLVLQFGELNEAYQAVVTAGNQIDVLRVAEEAYGRLQESQKKCSVQQEIFAGIDRYKEQRHRDLLHSEIANVTISIDQGKQEEARLEAIVRAEDSTLRNLRDQRAGAGGQAIERMEAQIKETEAGVIERERKRKAVEDAFRQLGWTLPDNPSGFAEMAGQAKTRLLAADGVDEDWQARRDEVVTKLKEKEAEFSSVRAEIAKMEENRSNIPSRHQNLRDAIARALRIAPEKLPFAGELMEVKQEAEEWHGGLERLLRGLSTSLLVDESHYQQVAQYLNDNHIGDRLVFLRMTARPPSNKTLTMSSSFRKLNFQTDNPNSQWLREEVRSNFDYECVNSMHEFRAATRALTREGQIKRNQSRHEKDDRFRVDERGQWVMGFDNKPKLNLFKQRAQDLGVDLSRLQADERALSDESKKRQNDLRSCQTITLHTWQDVDVGFLLAQVKKLQDSLTAERRARPELEELEGKIRKQDKILEGVKKELTAASGQRDSHERKKKELQEDLAKLREEHLTVLLTPTQSDGLRNRVEAMEPHLTLRNLSDVVRRISTEVNREIGNLNSAIQDEQRVIEKQFLEFNHAWPTDSSDLEPVFASAEEYFEKLAKLVTDGLPRYKQKFFDLLRDQGHHSLLALQHQMETERKEIFERLDQANASLEDVPFNPGTRLKIEPNDRFIQEVKDFQQTTRVILARALDEEDQDAAQQRFHSLRSLIERLKSQELVDRHWRELVLDVRRHVDFLAREFNEDGEEVEAYASGDGKSGGQRQKLTATCLAAALCYQLGGQDGARPRFSTVVLDEAFDKADSEFTKTAMSIFKSFTFQMVVATPMKSVMTLEPFIGGACYVQNVDRKTSKTLQMEYDLETHTIVGLNRSEHAEEAALS